MEYRKATIDDAEQIAKLLMDCFNVKSIEEGKEIFIRERKRDEVIVAEKDGTLHGIVSWFMRGEPKHQLIRIERLCALAGPERDEVAEGLLKTAIQDADKFFKKLGLKLRKIYTLVRSTNNKLKNFYKEKGFIEEAVIKDHYYKGEDEFVLSMFME